MINVNEIIINSPKYGKLICIVDSEDYQKICSHAWSILKGKRSKTYYATSHIKGKTILMHRLIMDAEKGSIFDHINGNGLDNRKENLRSCTQSQNCMNNRRIDNKWGFKGISFKKTHNRFVTTIRINKKPKIVGSYKTIKEAAMAYNKAAMLHYGLFAKLNVIPL